MNKPNTNTPGLSSQQESRSSLMNTTLDKHRRQIDDVDSRIVACLAERQAIIKEVVALKKKHRMPVYHPAREEDLISDRRHQGLKAGLDPDNVEELFRQILGQSRKSQSARLASKGIRAGETILLVGGAGEMGCYFHKWFADGGYKVKILDREDWPRVGDLCQGIALALLSVPIEATVEVAHKIGPHLPPECVLADITSNKEAPLKAMLEAHSGPVVGLHPLFGPTPSLLDKQIIAVTPGRDAAACQWLLDQFSAWGAVIVEADAREHDRTMEVVQALRHFATFGFGRFLSKRNIDLRRTLEFSSPIYRLEMGMVGRLFAQDPVLYAQIIFASPERRELLKSYLNSMMENMELLETGDTARFCEEFKRINQWFGTFSEQAMRESSFLIDKLIERF